MELVITLAICLTVVLSIIIVCLTVMGILSERQKARQERWTKLSENISSGLTSMGTAIGKEMNK